MNTFRFYQLRLASLVLCAALSDMAFQAKTTASEPLSDELYETLQRASVEILNDGRLAGSGCFVEAQGTVLTAAHVVTTSKKQLEVLTPLGQRLSAKLVAVDQGRDLALLQLASGKQNHPSLKLAETSPKAGKTVYVFGSALFRHGILMKGSVARNDTTFEYVDGRIVEIVHICAPSPGGLSGGPWVNSAGRVIGVQSSAMIVNQAHQGLSFAAPLSAIAQLINAKASVTTSTLGAAFEEIWERDETFLQALAPGTRGLILLQVKPQGPAATVGLKDFQIITEVDDKLFEKRDALHRYIRSKQAGDRIRLTVTDRTGRNPSKIRATLGKL